MMLMTITSVFLLIFSVLRFSSDGFNLKCSVMNQNLMKNVELPNFTYCYGTNYSSSGVYNDLSQGINYVNNSTGLISLDIPINPFGLRYRTPMKYTVRLFHCKNNSSVGSGCDGGLTEQHQHYTFYSRAVHCENSTNIPRNTTVLFHNVWTDKYKLAILQGDNRYLPYTFNVTTNFTKPTEINKKNMFFALSMTREDGLEARIRTTDQFGPSLNQMKVLIFNHSDLNCLTINSVAKVYINTTFVTEHCRSTVKDCFIKCDNEDTYCAAISDREIICYFNNLTLSDDFSGLLLFDNDLRCQYSAYGELRYNRCCVKATKEMLKTAWSGKFTTQQPNVIFSRRIRLFICLVVLVLIVIAVWLIVKSIPSPFPTTYKSHGLVAVSSRSYESEENLNEPGRTTVTQYC